MRLSELFAGVPIHIDGPDVDVSGLAYDSRRVTPGCLFAALAGARADGHEHVPAALDHGARAILCQRPVDCRGASRIVVDNSRAALALAARRWFKDPSAHMRLFGVTGTNGKTTTVHLLEAILTAAGERPGVVGTLGSRFAGREAETGLTTPESVELMALLANMRDAGTTAVAMETSSHALAQERVAGLDFDVGVFTNLSHDHLDYHGTLDAYFAAKARLFWERLKPTGWAVLNLDDPRVRELAAYFPTERLMGFGLGNAVSAGRRTRFGRLSLGPIGIEAEVCIDQRPPFEIRSNLVGRFNASNLLAAIAAAAALEISPDAIRQGVLAMTRVPGRLERVPSSGGPLVVVDYAHTPDALEKVLSAVREITRGRIVCVFGCGGDRDATKRPIMAETVARLADWAVVTSDNPRSEDPQAIIRAILTGFERLATPRTTTPAKRGFTVEVDRATAIELAIKAAGPRDSVVLAGKGHEHYQLVAGQKLDFDDCAHARAALQAAGFGIGTDRTEPITEG